MKMLIHTCCAPCLTFPLGDLRAKTREMLVFYYNPNIQPFQEYKLRRDCLREYCAQQAVGFVEGRYDFERFYQDVVFRESSRCTICYRLRLTEAAKYAKHGRFDCFTTSLLVSPYQKHDMLVEIGESVGSQYSVPFFYKDFRKGWRQAVSLARQLNLYRQKYCGCLYSEKERFYKQSDWTDTKLPEKRVEERS